MKSKLMIAIAATVALALGKLWASGPDADGAPADPPPGAAIYDPDPSHLWNRLHGVFFVRPNAGPDAADPDAIDPPSGSTRRRS